MDYYVELQLLPNPELVASVIMSELFQNVHLYLADRDEKHIGMSFPDIDSGCDALGSRMRMHGFEDALNDLKASRWLKRMMDYMKVGDVRKVPEKHRYRNVRRVQAKSNPDRLRRRMMRRKGVSYDEACDAIPDTVGERLKLPYLTLRSSSTGRNFRLFIAHMPIQDTPVRGEFSSYGLSPRATVPWF